MEKFSWFKDEKSKEEAKKVLDQYFLTRNTDDFFEKEKDLSKESFLKRLDELKNIIDKNKKFLQEYNSAKNTKLKEVLHEMIETENITPENIKKLEEEYLNLTAKYDAIYNNKDLENSSGN
jgi:ATP-dependent Zn protease